MEAGISTLGITFGYGVESTAGTKPTTFTKLNRINNIAGITIEPEQLDASALEDAVTRYVKGRADTGKSKRSYVGSKTNYEINAIYSPMHTDT